MKIFSMDTKKCTRVFGWAFVGLSFFSLSYIIGELFMPDISSNAATKDTAETVGPYSMSMSSDDAINIDITPTGTQTVYKKESNVTVTNTCPYGASVTMTSSSSKDSLTQVGAVSGETPREIPATTSTTLSDNAWGYSIDNGTTWGAVPINTGTPVRVYNSDSAQVSALELPMMYGLRVDSTLPSGTYANEVVYTMTPKPSCYSYTIVWDMDGGTGKSGVNYSTTQGWGDTINLSNLEPTKSGHVFRGWTQGDLKFKGSETNVNINPGQLGTITMKAKWQETCSNCTKADINLAVNGNVNWAYSGKCTEGAVKKEGYYKLEAWGGAGGKSTHGTRGGYGGYSVGIYKAELNELLFACPGNTGGPELGGYNGGGGGSTINSDSAAGGGAGHIALAPGLLSTLESKKDMVLLVAGGGGGSGCSNTIGGEGGGLEGIPAVDTHTDFGGPGGPGTQTAGGAGGTNSGSGSFGLGGTTGKGQAWPGGGGGGGWYGGGAGGNMSGGGGAGGGGSGYVNPILINAQTIAGNKSFPSPSGGTETGHNGYSYTKITYLGTSI